jgi:hypothetical protein
VCVCGVVLGEGLNCGCAACGRPRRGTEETVEVASNGGHEGVMKLRGDTLRLGGK